MALCKTVRTHLLPQEYTIDLVPGSNDTKSITVTHEIRFSSLTPTRVNLLEEFVGPQRDRGAHNATDSELAASHDAWSQTGQ